VVRSSANVSPTSFLLVLDVGPDFPQTRPGQFVSVGADQGLTLLRPFAIAGRPATNAIELLVEVKGRGTRTIVEKPAGSSVTLLGPLGNAFTRPPEGTTPILVAGGIGVAGLRLLAREIVATSGGLIALVGAKKAELLLDDCLPGQTEACGVEKQVATDDGSAGFHGTVTELLEETLEQSAGPLAAYCCGPPAMIRATARLTLGRGVPCQALLEERMACGIGACRGCVVATRGGYKCVCSDGPVFDVADLTLEERICA
jgi:dihydroorotate dehydrogenase electron transfer subunit